LDEVIARGMAKNPADRYATAGELARAAVQALASVPNPSGPQREATTVVQRTAPVRPYPPTRAEPESPSLVRRVALVGGALTVVLGLIVTGLMFQFGHWPLGSSTTTTTTTTSTSSTTSSPTTTTTTQSPQVRELLAALPAVYQTSSECTPSTPDGGAVAAVRCTKPGAWSPRYPAPDESEFRLFGDRAGQDAFFQALVTSRGIPRMDERGGCRPESDPIHYALYYRDTSGPLPGEFTTCFVADGNAQVWWVDTRTLTIGVVKRPGDLKTLDSLDLWWNTTILSAL
jgi:serine/threonine-protein kinase